MLSNPNPDPNPNPNPNQVITLALARGRIGAQEACAAARVAEQHQIDEWGEVDVGHDLHLG